MSLITTALTTVGIALNLAGLGALAQRALGAADNRDFEGCFFALTTGWAIVSLMAAICALFGWNIKFLLAFVVVGGISGLVTSVGWQPLLRLGIAWVVVAPLLIVALRSQPALFDEFAHWLPNTRFLIERDGFPTKYDPNIWSDQSGYPPAAPLIAYFVNLVTRQGFELTFKLFTVLVAGSFGLILARLLALALGPSVAILVGVSLATVLNPFFDPRIALTSYTDTPTAFLLAACVFSCWRSVYSPDPKWLLRVGTIGVVLVLLRETNIVLLGGLCIGLFLLGRSARVTSSVLCACSAGAFAIWRCYLWLAEIRASVVPRSITQWDWLAPVTLFRALIVDRLPNHLALGSAAIIVFMVIVLYAIFANHAGKIELRPLYILATSVVVTWLLFLCLTYVAVMGARDISLAISIWRYLTEIGPTIILTGIASVSYSFRKMPAIPIRVVAACVGALAPTVSVVFFWYHWHVGCQFPDVQFVRAAAREIAHVGEEQVPLVVLHPTESYGPLIDYALKRPLGQTLQALNIAAAPKDALVLDLNGVSRELLLKGQSPRLSVKRFNGNVWAAERDLSIAPTSDCH